MHYVYLTLIVNFKYGVEMKCPKINELDFSERGDKAIKEIRRIKDLNQWLSIKMLEVHVLILLQGMV